MASNDFAARYRWWIRCRGLYEDPRVTPDGDDGQDVPDSASADPSRTVWCGLRRRN